MTTLPRGQIMVGDVRQVLGQLPEASVDCVATSPPYYALRDYQRDGQIGLEASVDGWVDELRLVAQSLARVLKPTGSLWLNVADSYARHQRHGARPKSLLLGPERLALKLVADGWILRNKAVWSKPNGMPSSVRDRLTTKWEYVYCFVRNRDYFFDLDAIREPHKSRAHRPGRSKRPAWAVPPEWRAPLAGSNGGLDRLKASGLPGHALGRNPGDVWTIPTASYRGAHHAVYPEALVTRPLLAGCPEKVCARCGTPWWRQPYRIVNDKAVVGELARACQCGKEAGTRPGVVLDPFLGSGTTAVVAERLGRDWVGIELNPDFADQAEQRIAAARARTLTTEEPEGTKRAA